ncbi:non-ribosomal peptide synthetase [Brevibacillus laterosporus]|uniref:amino acid adenylation domain-containing protein n=1 Tax=Brevibacillus laterosporus TaxID=1465 RepID=UPI00215B9A04|nr:non-ribosomal peptide synthetase [Brevibacillus laterosporus]MCR8995236.1 amino acid adenylation domain-containing protein [Brevibacillus laterosporus]
MVVFNNRVMEQEQFWLSKLGDEFIPSMVPADYPYVGQTKCKASFQVTIEQEITDRLMQVCKNSDLLLYTFLLATAKIWLHKYTQQTEICVGAPNLSPSNKLVPIVSNPAPHLISKQFIRDVKQSLAESYKNQDYPLHHIYEKLDINPQGSASPFIKLAVALDRIHDRDFVMAQEIDFLLFFSKSDHSLQVTLHYDQAVYELRTLERFLSHYINILRAIVTDVNITISEIELMNEAEKAQLTSFSQTLESYSTDQLVHQVFEKKAERYPDKVAVVYQEQKITYRQLNEKANQLARHLREKGVEKDEVIALMVERSLEMIIGILGILKAGGAYLPIDPENPSERISYILADSQARLFLTQKTGGSDVAFAGERINLDEDELYVGETNNLAPRQTPAHLLYVIYTSGTTGNPKGVMVEHRNLINYVTWFSKQASITQDDSTMLLSSYAFDLGYTSLFPALLTGCTLHIVPKDTYLHPDSLLNYINKEQISFIKLTPSLFSLLVQAVDDVHTSYLPALRLVVTGGEPIQPIDVHTFHSYFPHAAVMNHYGPTEATIGTLAGQINFDEWQSFEKRPTIGKPISQAEVLIVNSDLQLVPIGVPGELCIAGKGLVRGYIGQPALTREKFIDHPFHLGERLYKTGDFARWDETGKVEFLGRMDQQVKIRGYRIEVGEIEKHIITHPSIHEAIVLAFPNDQNENELYSYYLSDEEVGQSELRQFLQQKVPDYMIPMLFIRIEKVPLTSNGKINRHALPKPDECKLDQHSYIAPSSEMEKQLVFVWKDILKREPIGVTDNFFQLGGHSLTAIKLAHKIGKKYGIRVTLNDIFLYSTVRDQIVMIEQSEQRVERQIEISQRSDFYPLSSMQRRLFLLHQFEGVETAYNMPTIWRFSGNLDLRKLEQAFQTLIDRHEALRTSFHVIDHVPMQRVHSNINFSLSFQTKTKVEEKQVIESFFQPFNLEVAPLFRAGVVSLSNDEYLLIVDMHHIISDGISISILMAELKKAYRDQNLPPLRIQYKDYAMWQQKWEQSEEYKQQKQFWLTQFSDELPVLNLPTDFIRPKIQTFKGDIVTATLSGKQFEAMKQLCQKNGATLYMFLLAAYNIVLAKYSNQEDIVVGTAVAGRNVSDLESVIGMFVNTLAIRNKPVTSKTFTGFLEEVKQQTIQAFNHQDYSLDELVENLSLPRDMGRNPLFDTMLTLQNYEKQTVELDGITIRPIMKDHEVAKFDITVVAVENEDQLQLSWEFSTDLWKKESAKQMLKHFITLMEKVSIRPEITIGEIEVLCEEEKNELLAINHQMAISYDKELTIMDLIECQVNLHPDHVAVVSDGNKLSYQELNQAANRLAKHLLLKGVKRNQPIGVMMDRSPELIISILAILKAGGVYVPISTNYPTERIEYMLEDSKVGLVVTNQYPLPEVRFEGEWIRVEEVALDENVEDITRLAKADDLVYIIYTSGSTGKPKGVMIQHRALHHFVTAMNKEFLDEISYLDRVLISTDISFDVSCFEIFQALINGSTLVLFNGQKFDVALLATTIREEKVTLAYIPPALLNQLYETILASPDQYALHKMLVGVEPIKDEVLARYLSLHPNMCIVNGYGPSEATICCTAFRYEKSEITGKYVSIGKPIGNTQVYILDSELHLVPKGVTGELWIAGEGLSLGYLNQPKLTEERFIANPFDSNTLMYRTGDKAKWTEGGNLEFLGRIDHQVKIRGYRVELGEIETLLLRHPEVKAALVMTRTDSYDIPYLCAYVVFQNNDWTSAPDATQILHQWLAAFLPDYMIPSFFIAVDEFKLTPNGKIDRKSLPEPNANVPRNEQSYLAPRNSFEEQMVRLWEEVLEVTPIGIMDNFFMLGGHSLKAFVLANQITQRFGLSLPLSDLFKAPTIAGLCDHLQKRESVLDKNVILLKKGSSKVPPLFLIHGQGGGVITFSHLARELECDCSVYGIQAVGYEGEADALSTVEEMAAHYIASIRRIAPTMPIQLVGWSFGGLVAYEMTKQLEQQGEQVELLAMIDCLPLLDTELISIDQSYKELDAVILYALLNGINQEDLAAVAEEEKMRFCWEEACKQKLFPDEEYRPELLSKLRIHATNGLAIHKYRISGQIDTDLHLFLASDESIRHQVTTSKEVTRWKPFTTGQIKSAYFSGDHYTMLEMPRVQQMAKILNELMI